MKADIFAEAGTTSRITREKLRRSEWDRPYILSDHGFGSLPRHVDVDDLHPPSNADTVTPRWVAGADFDEARISILTDPIQRVRNQGLPDARFDHGGVLMQEFVPNGVTITQE